MLEIDYLALQNASKALCVIFILVIVVVNSLLIFKIVRMFRFMQQPKNLILLSMVFGDIFLAVFSLVVDARKVFERADLSCSTSITAAYYQAYIIHFVYGVGVILLAAELLLRHKRQKPFLRNREVLEAFIYSAVPWVLMLVIVLPLTMAGMDWETCTSSSTEYRHRAKFWISVIVPASATVILCLSIMFVKLTPVSRAVRSSHHGLVVPKHTPATSQLDLARDGYVIQQVPISQQLPYSNNQANQYPLQGVPWSEYLPQPVYPSQEHIQHPYMAETTPSSQDIYGILVTKPDKERRVLLCVAVVYFACVIPQAALFIFQGSISAFAFTVILNTFGCPISDPS